MPQGIALIGEYTPDFEPHRATDAAIEHAGASLGMGISATWLSTADITPTVLERYAGIWVAPGSPYRDLQNTLWAIRHAREHRIPCLGTCGGFQHMMLEYARNVLGLADAHHAEYDPYASRLFISELACSLAGQEMPLYFDEGSRTAEIYGGTSAVERYYCNFGVNPEYIDLLTSGALRVAGSDHEGEIRVVELPAHPFFIGTLYVPQARSRPGRPHPLVLAFAEAALSRQTSVQS